jgi:CubicO group peptidase (beta-lactamase class C family)
MHRHRGLEIAVWLCLILVVAACRASPPTAVPVSSLPTSTRPPVSQPTSTPPEESSSYWPTEAWRTSTPEEQGIDSAGLVEMLDQIEEEGYPIHGIAIVRNGYLVLEAYVHPFRAEDRHYIASCTKSFVSALIGITLEQGYIDNLDQKLLDFFPERTVANVEAHKEAITLEHLLTMSSGLDWPGTRLAESLQTQMSQSQDWVQFVLDRPMAQEPGSSFRYNSGGSHLLAAIIRQTTGRTPLEFARENLFKPLGITDVYWPADPSGLNVGGGGLELRLTDLARFGYLYLQQGVWAGQALLPAKWVAASTTAQIETGYLDYDYGYQWWVDPAGGYHARGYGGQYIFVLPEQNMVVVFVSGFPGIEMETVPNDLLKTFIIPAATSTAALPANPEQVTLLEARLQRLAQPDPKPVPALPLLAKHISGRTYALEANGLGFRAFTFRLPEEPDSQVRLEIVYDHGAVEWTIGLDDLYRFTNLTEASGHGPGPMAAKGTWTNDKAFRLDFMEAGYTGTFYFIFEGTEVKVHFQGPWETETFAGTLQE